MGHNAELKVYKTVLLEKENPILDHGFFLLIVKSSVYGMNSVYF